jgi:hypothetical protein
MAHTLEPTAVASTSPRHTSRRRARHHVSRGNGHVYLVHPTLDCPDVDADPIGVHL